MKYFKLPLYYQFDYIFDANDNIKIFIIRSWGRLTSTEKLTPCQAKKAQDEFGEMITNKLNSE